MHQGAGQAVCVHLFTLVPWRSDGCRVMKQTSPTEAAGSCMIRFKAWTASIAVGVALALQGCGGGGGGGAEPASDTAPTVVKPSSVAKIATSLEPSGGTAAPADLFPVHQGDVWINDVLDTSTVADGVPSGALETNTITSLLNGVMRLRTTQDVSKTDDSDDYVVQAAGVATGPDFFGVFPSKANPRVDSFVVYPTQTLPPVGQARSYVRQGDTGEDLDKDGTTEGFRFEFSQVFLGVETRTVAYSPSPKQVWHFRTTMGLSIFVSSQNNAAQIQTSVTDEYLEPGVGVVRSDALITDSAGVSRRDVTELKSALVGGLQKGPVLVANQAINVPVSMSSVNYVSSKQLFVGIVSNSFDARNGQIAMVDAQSGAVLGYSAAGGPGLYRLVAAPNSGVLYATTRDNQVIRLSIGGSPQAPTLTETGRFTQPTPEGLDPSFADFRYAPSSIAVSPQDPNTLVLATYAPAFATGTRYRLFVYQDMTLVSTLDNAGIGFVQFNEAGNQLIGYRFNETVGDQRLFAMSLNGSQLQIQNSVTHNNFVSGLGVGRPFDYYQGALYTGLETVSFTDLNTASLDDYNCPVLPGTNRKICPSNGDGLLLKSMANNQQTLFKVSIPDLPTMVYGYPIIPGPSGVVALQQYDGAGLLLIKHPQLQ